MRIELAINDSTYQNQKILIRIIASTAILSMFYFMYFGLLTNKLSMNISPISFGIIALIIALILSLQIPKDVNHILVYSTLVGIFASFLIFSINFKFNLQSISNIIFIIISTILTSFLVYRLFF